MRYKLLDPPAAALGSICGASMEPGATSPSTSSSSSALESACRREERWWFKRVRKGSEEEGSGIGAERRWAMSNWGDG